MYTDKFWSVINKLNFWYFYKKSLKLVKKYKINIYIRINQYSILYNVINYNKSLLTFSLNIIKY